MYKCSTRPKWAVEWLGGSFLGQDNISLIRQLAASSDPEDPGCSRTHTRLHWLPAGLTHFPSLSTCSGGCGASRWNPTGTEDSVDHQEGGKGDRGCSRLCFKGSRSAIRVWDTRGRGALQAAERRPPPPSSFSFNASGELNIWHIEGKSARTHARTHAAGSH